jgi:hypothetical protein
LHPPVSQKVTVMCAFRPGNPPYRGVGGLASVKLDEGAKSAVNLWGVVAFSKFWQLDWGSAHSLFGGNSRGQATSGRES